IVDLAERGFSFGSHTRTHRDLTHLPLDAVSDELVLSKKEIEVRLGDTVDCLSYPFGRFNASIVGEAAHAGYRAAFSLYPPHSNSSVDRFALRREGVYIIDTISCLKTKLGIGPLFWVEDLKGRAINSVASLTPLLKRIGRCHL
ncbi:MAG: polysaccharide deacetylase family protein, partial [Candidatus Krumholzibacteria bacterium]|nr:polysaccharide deacetylase family protein [Candidatus Krumholzibacteria bacterium]